MLNAIGFLIKVAVFSVLVLVIGNWAKWDGKTLSDRVRETANQVSQSDTAAKVREWSRSLAQDAREGADKRMSAKPGARHHAKTLSAANDDRTESASSAPSRTHSEASSESDKERIPSSERQKLRDLIRELNNSDR